MRHRVAHRKLGRVTEHRISLLRNQATALLRHEHLTTTVPKAKELRPFVERIITIAKRGLASGDANGRVLNARRLVMADLQDREVVSKLFDAIAPRFADRAGGYTRLLRIGYRKGDSAEIAQVELVGSEFDPKAKVDAPAEKADEGDKKKAGMSGRLRAAAERLRGKKGEAEGGGKVSTKPAKGAGRKATTPRKAGGS
jgi:large subunit ribosomal protein L17